jgi:hypothetical protein
MTQDYGPNGGNAPSASNGTTAPNPEIPPADGSNLLGAMPAEIRHTIINYLGPEDAQAVRETDKQGYADTRGHPTLPLGSRVHDWEQRHVHLLENRNPDANAYMNDLRQNIREGRRLRGEIHNHPHASPQDKVERFQHIGQLNGAASRRYSYVWTRHQEMTGTNFVKNKK